VLEKSLRCMMEGVSKAGEPRNLERDRAHRALKRCGEEVGVGDLARAVQASLGYVPPRALPLLAEKSGLTAQVLLKRLESMEGIRLEPECKQRVEICSGRTCAGRGGAKLIRLARRHLDVNMFETTPGQHVRLEPFRCFGQCARAPNIRMNGVIQGAMTEKRFGLLLGLLSRNKG
jgi:NADH:ubiquinone oxidoreductase subunit E